MGIGKSKHKEKAVSEEEIFVDFDNKKESYEDLREKLNQAELRANNSVDASLILHNELEEEREKLFTALKNLELLNNTLDSARNSFEEQEKIFCEEINKKSEKIEKLQFILDEEKENHKITEGELIYTLEKIKKIENEVINEKVKNEKLSYQLVSLEEKHIKELEQSQKKSTTIKKLQEIIKNNENKYVKELEQSKQISQYKSTTIEKLQEIIKNNEKNIEKLSFQQKEDKNSNKDVLHVWILRLCKEFISEEWCGMISTSPRPQRPNFNVEHLVACLQTLDYRDYNSYNHFFESFKDVNRRIKNRVVAKEFKKNHPVGWEKCNEFDCWIGLEEDFTSTMKPI